jgi:hypothetical protein
MGEGCSSAVPICNTVGIRDVLSRASDLKKQLTLTGADSSTDCTKSLDDCSYPIFDDDAFLEQVATVRSDINSLSAADQTAGDFNTKLTAITDREGALVASLPATASVVNSSIDALTKDLSQYAASIYMANGTEADGSDKSISPKGLGRIYDPLFSPNPGLSVPHPHVGIIAAGHWPLKRFGRQAVFAVDAVNLVDTSAASVPSATAKKAIATITVLYADPIFEASAGTFFSLIPNRTFANQTNFGQNPDGTTTYCATTTTPIYCSTSVTEQDKLPTVVPFVGANWRLGHDFLWPGGRRGATYFTAALGINPNSATTEYAAGFSVSWRAIMLSPLYHLGRDIHLTQGETVGEILCYYNPPTTGATVDKCGSPSTPNPPTKPFWRGAFAIGLSIRVPSVFSGASSGH